MYALIVDGAVEEYPASINTLKTKNPNTLFPKSFDDFDYAEYGIVEVTDPGQPDFDNTTHQLVSNNVELVDGVWTVVYRVEPFTEDELAKISESLAAFVRSERNQKLADTDWTQLADSSADATTWAGYRSALRDLPTTEGFPHNITWPTEPA